MLNHFTKNVNYLLIIIESCQWVEINHIKYQQIIFQKYLQPLQSPEHAGLVDSSLVDEIFYMVPAILSVHEKFLEELKKRLEVWDAKQKVGDVFLDAVSN